MDKLCFDDNKHFDELTSKNCALSLLYFRNKSPKAHQAFKVEVSPRILAFYDLEFYVRGLKSKKMLFSIIT